MTQEEASNYRWVVLSLAALTHTLVVGMPMMAIPVLFKEMSEDLGLSMVQIGTVWGTGSAAGICIVLISGLLGDRFGIKRVLIVFCLLVGVFGAMRGLSESFVALMITTFLNGLLTAAIPINVHKTAAVWFPNRQLALANGILSTGVAIGFVAGAMISATILSPLLGGWRNVMFFYGGISIVISVFWMLIRSQSASYNGYINTVAFRQALSQVVRLGSVWTIGLTMFCFSACYQGMRGYLALHLRGVGWTEAAADSTLAVCSAVSVIGVIPIALLSDKFGSRKVILFIGMLMAAIGVGLLSTARGPMVWTSVIIAGLFFDGFMAILFTLVMETEGVGTIYAGTAIGVVQTISMLGSAISPALGNSLAGIHTGLPFVFWATFAVAGLFGILFIKETGHRRQQ